MIFLLEIKMEILFSFLKALVLLHVFQQATPLVET